MNLQIRSATAQTVFAKPRLPGHTSFHDGQNLTRNMQLKLAALSLAIAGSAAAQSRILYTVPNAGPGFNPGAFSSLRVTGAGLEFAVTRQAQPVNNQATQVQIRFGNGGALRTSRDGTLQNVPGVGLVSDGFGEQIVAPGDLDNDGYPELVISSPYWQPSFVGGVLRFRGRVQCFSGLGFSNTSTPLWTSIGAQPTSELGSQMILLPNMGASSAFEIACAASDNGAFPQMPYLRILLDNGSLMTADIALPNGARKLVSLGNFNQTISNDVAVSHALGGPGITLVEIIGGTLTQLQKPNNGTEFGVGMTAHPGDLSGTAQTLFANERVNSNLGFVHAFTSASSFTSFPGTSGAEGFYLDTTSDINGDGTADVISMASNDVSNGPLQPVKILDKSPALQQATIWDPNILLAVNVADLGDVTGDGFDEFAVWDNVGWRVLWGGPDSAVNNAAGAGCVVQGLSSTIAVSGALADGPFTLSGTTALFGNAQFVFWGTPTTGGTQVGTCTLWLDSSIVPLQQLFTVNGAPNAWAVPINLPLLPALFGIPFGFQSLELISPNVPVLSNMASAFYGW